MLRDPWEDGTAAKTSRGTLLRCRNGEARLFGVAVLQRLYGRPGGARSDGTPKVKTGVIVAETEVAPEPVFGTIELRCGREEVARRSRGGI